MRFWKAGFWIVLVCLFAAEGVAYAQVPKGTASHSLPEVISTIKTPEALAGFMKKEFKYIEDGRLVGQEDYWQSPEELWRRKAGDCEDFAVFAKYVLENQGIETQVVSLYGPNGYAHTVAVFKEGGRYNVINEDRLYAYRAESIEEALSRINPSWVWGAVSGLRKNRGWLVRALHNPAPAPNPSWDPFSEQPF